MEYVLGSNKAIDDALKWVRGDISTFCLDGGTSGSTLRIFDNQSRDCLTLVAGIEAVVNAARQSGWRYCYVRMLRVARGHVLYGKLCIGVQAHRDARLLLSLKKLASPEIGQTGNAFIDNQLVPWLSLNRSDIRARLRTDKTVLKQLVVWKRELFEGEDIPPGVLRDTESLAKKVLQEAGFAFSIEFNHDMVPRKIVVVVTFTGLA